MIYCNIIYYDTTYPAHHGHKLGAHLNIAPTAFRLLSNTRARPVYRGARAEVSRTKTDNILSICHPAGVRDIVYR